MVTTIQRYYRGFFHGYPFQPVGNPFYHNVLGGARVLAVGEEGVSLQAELGRGLHVKCAGVFPIIK